MVVKDGIPSGDKSQALDWHGYEVVLTPGGQRNSKESVLKSSADNDSIPVPSRQSSYESEHGCVWLSAC